ncbi:P-loop ATPase, Sll1717 family [Bowmanella denitrificans]|uniref:P-loop ATPase, Sll1717 family n=1 Tax=Bowmanella denitrificans TaxID=366582 RepID=UPI000C9A480E|nr:hypothetical protein [Bowmanella denitrificans]
MRKSINENLLTEKDLSQATNRNKNIAHKKISQILIEFDEVLDVYKSTLGIDWLDESVLGKPDANHESVETLKNIYIERPGCKDFFDSSKNLIILNSPKGSGKTTLCKVFNEKLQNGEEYNNVDSIFLLDSDVSPSMDINRDYSEWKRLWENNICKAIILKFAILAANKKFKLTFDSDLNYMIEEAKENGEIESSAVDFFRSSVKLPIDKDILQHRRGKFNYVEILKRIMSKADRNFSFWLFVDEVDSQFFNTPQHINKVGSFLHVLANLANSIKGLKVRSTIRPNVKKVLDSKDSNIANLGQLIFCKLKWNDEELKQLIAKRIYHHINRKRPELFNEHLFDMYYGQVVDQDSFVKEEKKSSQNYLANLSHHRPRWLMDLISRSGKYACDVKKGKLIDFYDVQRSLGEYGRARIADLSAEYQNECNDLSKLTAHLTGLVNSKLTYNVLTRKFRNITDATRNISVFGSTHENNPHNIVELLYYVGILVGKTEERFIQKKVSSEGFTSTEGGKTPKNMTFDEDDQFIFKCKTSDNDGKHKIRIHEAFEVCLDVAPVKKRKIRVKPQL